MGRKAANENGGAKRSRKGAISIKKIEALGNEIEQVGSRISFLGVRLKESGMPEESALEIDGVEQGADALANLIGWIGKLEKVGLGALIRQD